MDTIQHSGEAASTGSVWKAIGHILLLPIALMAYLLLYCIFREE